MDRQLRTQVTLLRGYISKQLSRCQVLEIRRKEIAKVQELFAGDPNGKYVHDTLARENYRLLKETADIIAEVSDAQDKLNEVYDGLLHLLGSEADEERLSVENETLAERLWDEYKDFVGNLYEVEIDLESDEWLNFA